MKKGLILAEIAWLNVSVNTRWKVHHQSHRHSGVHRVGIEYSLSVDEWDLTLDIPLMDT